MYISTIRGTVNCPFCQLSQFERGSETCLRCHRSLGFSYIELLLSTQRKSSESQSQAAIRQEVGSLIRRLRIRRGLTQSELTSLTGINRTYLSRAERGQVMPSVIALMQIASALGIDKMLLRVRNSSTESWG